MKMRPMGCPETSVRNYHYLLRNNLEEHSFQAKIDLIIKKRLAIYSHEVSVFIPGLWVPLTNPYCSPSENILHHLILPF